MQVINKLFLLSCATDNSVVVLGSFFTYRLLPTSSSTW